MPVGGVCRRSEGRARGRSMNLSVIRFTRSERVRRGSCSRTWNDSGMTNLSAAGSQTKKRFQLGANRKLEPPKSQTLKRDSIQTVRSNGVSGEATSIRSVLHGRDAATVSPQQM